MKSPLSLLAVSALISSFHVSGAFTPSSSISKGFSQVSTALFSAPEPLGTEGEWTAYLDEETTGVVYYFNTQTGESRWEPPTDTFPSVYLKPSRRKKAEAKQEEYFEKMEEEEMEAGLVGKLLGSSKKREGQQTEELLKEEEEPEWIKGMLEKKYAQEEKQGFFSRLLNTRSEAAPAPKKTPFLDNVFQSMTEKKVEKPEPFFADVGESESEKAARIAEEERIEAARVKAEAEKVRKQEEQLRKQEEERRKQEEQLRKQEEKRALEARSKAKQEADKRKAAEAKKQAKARAKAKQEEDRRKAAEAKKQAEAKAKAKQEEDRRKAAEAKKQAKAEAQAKKQAEEERKMRELVRKAEAEQKAEADMLAAEERRAEQEARKAEVAEAKRIAAEERKAAAEAKRAEQEARKAEAAEAKRIAEEERKAAAEAKRAEQEARKAEAAEAKRVAEEQRLASAEAKPASVAAEEQNIVEEKITPIKVDIASCVLPHPSKILWGGEDAVFTKGRTFGVFDGVSGADKLDGKPLYSKMLARQMPKLVGNGKELAIKDMQDNLLAAAEIADKKATGASTAIVACITDDGVLRAVNLGDSVCVVIRGDRIVAKTVEIIHYFDCPYQLSDISPDRPRDVRKLSFELMRGDIVLMGSDGIFDNLGDSELVQVVNSGPAKAGAIAKRVSDRSRKVSLNSKAPTPYATLAKRWGDPKFQDGLGGKVDDISCVVARYD
ncbi:protein phosphatase 2C BIPP2C1 [Seminavis robusta]|uniref:Protein phosphatase n=1 Tax=Seminavis robusta TaxID=568900 RepID=A0A9N8H453_9STRA|nr:protein phosphatase 2C BIPP2C1 [Seminavis robusta]|eukprot:Sro4_g003530.1 protein phosphatase 2C BIPP2C1 (720) ;mRNA; r:177322-179481